MSSKTEPSVDPRTPRRESPLGRVGRSRYLVTNVLPPLLLFIAFLVGWQAFISITDQPSYIVPGLPEIGARMFTEADKLLPSAWVTLTEILTGFALGVSVGFLLGVLIVQFKIVGRAVYPIVIASQAIPVIAIAPVLIIWFGFGILPKVFMAALITFFPMVINTTAGLLSVEKETFDLMRSLQASRPTIFWKVSLPAALPYVFAGLKNSAVISAIGAIVGEYVGAERGLGPLILAANASFQTALVFAAIVYLAVTAMILFALVSIVERLVIPWYFLTRARRSLT